VTRHFVTIEDLSRSDLEAIYELSCSPFDDETLKGQGVALVFERPSLRTRASSSSAVHELGGYVTFFSDEEVGLDSRECAEDIACTLAQMYAISALRVRDHRVFGRMRAASNDAMSLVNLLSDMAHPTQAVADVLTIAEHFTGGDVRKLRGLEVAYVGDATNVTRSLCVALLRLGANVTVAAPAAYQLAQGGPEDPFAIEGGSLTLSESPDEAVRRADVIYTDAWVSMGLEAETEQRRRDFAPFQVNAALLEKAKSGVVVMHCLPAHRGDEITNEVIDGEESLVWRQVFHRRSAMLGVLRWIKKEDHD
jgi:ornithine carbamoyltransferase